jgi:hypothetical protein
MSNDNSELLQKIKEAFKLESKVSGTIRLPEAIEFRIIEKSVAMHLPAKAITKNMQGDAAAFEGWALVLKRWGKFEKVMLSWEQPISVEDGHYQRFLFRAHNFAIDFAAWFSITMEARKALQELKIKESGYYFLNTPSKYRKVVESQNEESKLEKRFVSGDWTQELKRITGAHYLTNQWPVGVFEGKVSKPNSIFTGGKSAIDMLGIDKQNQELLLFELKKERNHKIGIISELYFYCCILRCVQTRQFKFEESKPILDNIAKTTKIDAIFLAPGLHPLIDKHLVSDLNFGMNPKVSFRYIKFVKTGENVVIKDGFDPDKP